MNRPQDRFGDRYERSRLVFSLLRQVSLLSLLVVWIVSSNPAWADWQIAASYTGNAHWTSQFPTYFSVSVNNLSGDIHTTSGTIDLTTSNNNPPSTTTGGITGNFSAAISGTPVRNLNRLPA